MLKRTLATTAFVTLALVGCGDAGNGLATVTGSVSIDGKPASRGSVTFHPASGGPPAIGSVRDGGRFALRIGRGGSGGGDASAIPSDQYRVTVVVNGAPTANEIDGGPPVPGPRLMASRYGSVATTDLIAEVQAGANAFDFDLDPAEPEEEVADEPVDDSDDSSNPETTVADSADDSASDESAEVGSQSDLAEDAKPTEPATPNTVSTEDAKQGDKE